MRKFKFLSIFAVAFCALSVASQGFFLGSDKYSVEEYKKFGIKHVKNKILLDEYYFEGLGENKSGHEKITQETAEKTGDFYGKMVEQIGWTSEGQFLAAYNTALDFALSLESKEKKRADREENRANYWQNAYYNLLNNKTKVTTTWYYEEPTTTTTTYYYEPETTTTTTYYY